MSRYHKESTKVVNESENANANANVNVNESEYDSTNYECEMIFMRAR